MKKVLLLIVSVVSGLFIPITLSSQVPGAKNVPGWEDKVYAILGLQDLKSTHNTYFKGGTLVVNYAVTPVFFLGLGLEYSYCPFHHDNASDLSNLRYVPLFIDTRMSLRKEARLVPYWRLSTGVSFATYTNKELDTQRSPYIVKDRGLYTLAALGCSYKIGRFFNPFIEIGLKGFHMSFNNMDINPHGSLLTLGFVL